MTIRMKKGKGGRDKTTQEKGNNKAPQKAKKQTNAKTKERREEKERKMGER